MAERDESPERFQISIGQVAASSLAAVSAAVVCSFFGVAGTVIGTAIASFVATVGGALYSYSLRRTRARLRQLHRAGAASPSFAEVMKTMRQHGRFLLDRTQWLSLAIGVGAVFVFSIGVITAIEDATSIGATPLRAHHPHPHTAPVVPVSTRTASATPSATATATPTGKAKPHPTQTTGPTTAATVTVTATPPPSATLTPQPTATPTVAPDSTSPSAASS
jgi:hypothetical protein